MPTIKPTTIVQIKPMMPMRSPLALLDRSPRAENIPLRDRRGRGAGEEKWTSTAARWAHPSKGAAVLRDSTEPPEGAGTNVDDPHPIHLAVAVAAWVRARRLRRRAVLASRPRAPRRAARRLPRSWSLHVRAAAAVRLPIDGSPRRSRRGDAPAGANRSPSTSTTGAASAGRTASPAACVHASVSTPRCALRASFVYTP